MKTTITILSLCIFIFGCSPYKLVSIPYEQPTHNPPSGILYYQPKTQLKLKVTYLSTKKTVFANGIKEEKNPEYKVKTVEVLPITVNNPEIVYVLSGENEKHFFLEKNFNIKINQFGIIQSLENEVTDKTLDAVENFLKGVVSIAKTVVLAGDRNSEFESKIRVEIAQANLNLTEAIAKNNTVNIKKIKSQLLSYYELLKQYYENNRTIITESEIIREYLVDSPKQNEEMRIPYMYGTSSLPNIVLKVETSGTLNVSEQRLTETLTIPPMTPELPASTRTTAQDPPPLSGPEITPMSPPTESPASNSSTPSSPPATTVISKEVKEVKNPTGQIDGLVYTVPKACKVQIIASIDGLTQILFSNTITFPQFGHIASLAVNSKLFTRKKSAIDFDPATGTLSAVKNESGASSDNLSKSVTNSADLLQKAVTELKYDLKIENLKKEKEIKDLKDSLTDKPTTEVESLQQNLDILKLQLEIEKLKSELEKIK